METEIQNERYTRNMMRKAIGKYGSMTRANAEELSMAEYEQAYAKADRAAVRCDAFYESEFPMRHEELGLVIQGVLNHIYNNLQRREDALFDIAITLKGSKICPKITLENKCSEMTADIRSVRKK